MNNQAKHCKFCGMSATDTKWAREDGMECNDCRNVLRMGLKGTKKEKAEQKKKIEQENKTEEGMKFYIENTLTPWLAISETERGGYGNNKGQFIVTPLRSQVSRVQTDSFAMTEELGVLWPTAIFEQHFKKSLHPEEMRTIKGRTGAILPRVPGEALPPGVFVLSNSSVDGAERRDVLEDTDCARSRLLPDQVDRAAAQLAKVAHANIVPTFSMERTEEGDRVPCYQPPPPPLADTAPDDKKSKRRKKTEVAIHKLYCYVFVQWLHREGMGFVGCPWGGLGTIIFIIFTCGSNTQL